MAFITKSPLEMVENDKDECLPMSGTRALCAKQDGWYDVTSDGKVSKLITEDNIGANKPYIINAVGDPNTTYSRNIIRYPEETENAKEILTQAMEAYASGRQVILRVDGLSSAGVVDFSQVGSNSRNDMRFYGTLNGILYEVVEKGSSFLTNTTPLGVEFVVNATIDGDKNVSADVAYSQLTKALNDGKQLMLKLSDTSTGTSVFGQMTAKTTDSVMWHMCLGTEVYEISCESILDYETETSKEVWTAKLVTMATDDELNKVFIATEKAIVKIGSYYGEEDKDGAQDVMLYGDSTGYGSQESKLFRLTRTIKDASDDLPTSGAVYDALGNCVKNTDYATLDTPGVVKVHPGDNNPYGIHISDGVLRIACAGIDDINAGVSYAKPIVPAMLDTAVKACTNQDLTAELTAEQLKLPPSTQAIKDALGDIEAALDGIIAMQNTLIGGDVV